MSAQQVRVLFDSSALLLGQIVQRMSETWRNHEAEAIQQMMNHLVEQVKQGNNKKK